MSSSETYKEAKPKKTKARVREKRQERKVTKGRP